MISAAAEAGGGTIIRGGVARGFPEPRTDYPEQYQRMIRERNARYEQTHIDDLLDGGSPMEFMLRFTISHPDMHTTIVGTKNPQHLAANIAAASKGPLPSDIYEEAKKRFPGPTI
jgi:aryl-alcohol dehydrogenase-like predicted oxidoreductase